MIIGVDPNFSTIDKEDKVGVAIIEDGRFCYIDKVKFLFLVGFLQRAAEAGGALVLEKPSKNLHSVSAVFAAAARTSGNIAAAKIIAKRASDIGALWYQARLIEQYAASVGLKTICVDEKRRLRCDKGYLKKASASQLRQIAKGGLPSQKKYLSKLDAKRFNELTGYDKRTNEDGRDAALLIIDYLK